MQAAPPPTDESQYLKAVETMSSGTTSGGGGGGGYRRIVAVVGRGATAPCGIPNFRSDGGLSQQVPAAVLTASATDRQRIAENPILIKSAQYFPLNPLPYHEVRRPFILQCGSPTYFHRWRPTLGHALLRLCHEKGALRRVYTENIDGLELAPALALPPELVVPAFGTLREVCCESCGLDPYVGDYTAYTADVRANIKDIYGVDETAPLLSTPIKCRLCGEAKVKPATVLYGSNLPFQYHAATAHDFDGTAQVILAIGADLDVNPLASLVANAPSNCQRIFVGCKEWRGERRLSDVFLSGPCDESCLRLMHSLEWFPGDLEAFRGSLCEASQAQWAASRSGIPPAVPPPAPKYLAYTRQNWIEVADVAGVICEFLPARALACVALCCSAAHEAVRTVMPTTEELAQAWKLGVNEVTGDYRPRLYTIPGMQSYEGSNIDVYLYRIPFPLQRAGMLLADNRPAQLQWEEYLIRCSCDSFPFPVGEGKKKYEEDRSAELQRRNRWFWAWNGKAIYGDLSCLGLWVDRTLGLDPAPENRFYVANYSENMKNYCD